MYFLSHKISRGLIWGSFWDDEGENCYEIKIYSLIILFPGLVMICHKTAYCNNRYSSPNTQGMGTNPRRVCTSSVPPHNIRSVNTYCLLTWQEGDSITIHVVYMYVYVCCSPLPPGYDNYEELAIWTGSHTEFHVNPRYLPPVKKPHTLSNNEVWIKKIKSNNPYFETINAIY